MPAARWVVWSEEHKQWWAAGGWSYTPSLRLAGRYTEIEAKAIAQKANRYLPPGALNEVAMPDPLEARSGFDRGHDGDLPA